MAVTSQQLAKTLVYMAAEKPDDIKKVTQNFIAFLEKNHLTGLLPNVLRHLNLIKKNQDEMNTFTLVSPYDLSKGTVDTILKTFDSQKDAPIEKSIDESLIGGVVVKHGGMLYDGSIKGQLEKLRMTLLG